MTPRISLRTYKGAVAIITGGASGIGRAIGEELARQGAKVVLADLQIALAEEVAEGIRSRGGEAVASELDVTNFPATDRLVQNVIEKFGRLDYMFNNAGIGVGGEVSLYKIEDWHRVFDINILGVVNGIQAAYPAMIKQGFGHIVNTASMAGLTPTPLTVSYGASKHAIVGLSTSLRVEAAALGIRVSVLCPGVIRTSILDGGGKYGKMLKPIPRELQIESWEKLRPMAPDVFAEKALRAIARNKPIIIIPSWWKISWWINRLSPSLGLIMAKKLFEIAKENLEKDTTQ